ncbi:hypothetical protein ACLMAB_12295 [Brevibacillus laterosporus]
MPFVSTNRVSSRLDRRGRSILHEISNEQLEIYVNDLQYNLPTDQPLEERDRWTLWIARK